MNTTTPITALLLIATLATTSCAPLASDDDCYVASTEPVPAWLTFSTPEGEQPRVGHELHVGVQLTVDQPEICHQSFDVHCGCTDPAPALRSIDRIEAHCTHDSCTVLGTGAIGYLGEVRIVPHASPVHLQITVLEPAPLNGEASFSATGSFDIEVAP